MKERTYTIEQIQELYETNSGVCLFCGQIRWGNTEPDAENYPCDGCGENKVIGSHWILFSDAAIL